MVPSKSVKRPLTFEIIRCFTEKPTCEWDLSILKSSATATVLNASASSAMERNVLRVFILILLLEDSSIVRLRLGNRRTARQTDSETLAKVTPASRAGSDPPLGPNG